MNVLNLIPEVKSISVYDGFLDNKAISQITAPLSRQLQIAVNKLPCDQNGVKLDIQVCSYTGEAYTLDISAGLITIKAEGPAGAFYGIQTLRQILGHDTVPFLHIEDKPDFAYRGFYHDITRGKVPTVETLKSLIDRMAYYKMNSLQLYVEHTFAFEEYTGFLEKTGYLTADEIRELDDYCADNFIEFIPSLSCFGHLYDLLQQDRYSHLQVLDNYEQQAHHFWERMLHHTLDPLNPESFDLIRNMLDQYLPLFRSDKFNICCDETFDLNVGKYQGSDIGLLYADFVKKLIAYLHTHGKQIMMWGDYLLHYPERISDIPKDVILLNWDYEANADRTDKQIRTFAESGRKQIVCPGTWCWSNLCEKTSLSIPNISNVVEIGHRYGAMGVLNTNWGDFGNPCSLELAMLGLTYGAAKSWNVQTLFADFIGKAEQLVYGRAGAYRFIDALNKVEDTVRWKDLMSAYSNFLYGDYHEVKLPDKESLLAAIAQCETVYNELREEVWERDSYRQELLIAAEGLQVIAELLGNMQGFDLERHTDTLSWLTKYRDMWITKNKPSELSEIEKMFVDFEFRILKEQTAL